MAKAALAGGFYQARSLIANAQRCVNLYPEVDTQDSPFPTTHYPTPGLTLWTAIPQSPIRGIYPATNGNLYVVAGGIVYLVGSDKTTTVLGSIVPNITPISMVDNGSVLIIVDGTPNGYVVDLTTGDFGQISNPAFYGAISVKYVDTYFIFNRPGTNQFYITLSNLNFSGVEGGPIASGTITSGGIGYTDGTFTNIPLTGGAGTGAIATLTVAGTIVTAVTISNAGQNYVNGDALSAALSAAGGIATFSGITADPSIAAGTYTKSLIGGSGTGATAQIIISATGAVTSMTVVAPGAGYGAGNAVRAEFTDIDGEPAYVFATIATVTGTASGFVYTITAGSTSFDSLDIAAKTGFPDQIATINVIHREIWLIGQSTTEVWYNTGAADFTFGIMPGVFIQHGCIAPYSVAQQDLTQYWLSLDPQGKAMVLAIVGYAPQRISTHAIESVIQEYPIISDAEGFTYQQDGHVFYVLNFPSGNATWVYDATSQLWHQRAYRDNDGNLNRHLPNVAAQAFGLNLVGDWNSGNIYYYDLNSFNDNGQSVPRIRSWPHMQNEDKRVIYTSFIADMEVGNLPNVTTSTPPYCWLRWSDDRGKTWGNAVQQSLGSGGQYTTSVQFRRLGMARDRVFELEWSADVRTALNGAYVEMMPCQT